MRNETDDLELNGVDYLTFAFIGLTFEVYLIGQSFLPCPEGDCLKGFYRL